MSLLECLGAGIIPLVADLPGCEGLIDDPPMQQLAQPHDITLWAQRVRQLHHAPDLDARGARARALAAPWTWHALAPRWERWLLACARQRA